MLEAQHQKAAVPTRIRQNARTSVSKAHWTPEEDQLLLTNIKSGDRANWTELAPLFPGKTPQQISERWSKVVDPALVKGGWSPEEDEIIRQYVACNGTKNWTKLATLLPGRIGKQCRERWRNHLDPSNSKDPWTPEEDQKLIELHRQYGNKWVTIASFIPGRSDNHIKNRWNSTLKKREESNATVGYATPQKKGKKTIDPPNSVETLPKPDFDDILKPQLPPSTAWGMFTPQMENLTLAGERSPFLLGQSPLITCSPWLDVRRDAALFSPLLQQLDGKLNNDEGSRVIFSLD